MKHPLAEHEAASPPGAVAFGADEYSVDDDGAIDCPDGVVDDLREHYADRYEWYEPDDDESPESAVTCDVVKNDGEVCGRDLPCSYHSDDEDDAED